MFAVGFERTPSPSEPLAGNRSTVTVLDARQPVAVVTMGLVQLDEILAAADAAMLDVLQFSTADSVPPSLSAGCVLCPQMHVHNDSLERLARLAPVLLIAPSTLIAGVGLADPTAGSFHRPPISQTTRLGTGRIEVLPARTPPREIVAAIRRLTSGPNGGKEKVSGEQPILSPGELAEILATLTKKEREILDFLVAGLANKVIAIRLQITERAVEMRRATLVKKLRPRTWTAVVAAVRAHSAGR